MESDEGSRTEEERETKSERDSENDITGLRGFQGVGGREYRGRRGGERLLVDVVRY